jgi:probable rRNA maturation factor
MTARIPPAPRRAALPLQLSVQFASPLHRIELPRHRLLSWVRAALRCGPADATLDMPGPDAAAQITLRLVGADEGRALNLAYRGKDYATNVLTFDYQPWPPAADIVLCDSVIAAEAREQDKDLQAHYAHMVIHGVLHALGWDHLRAADAKRMEALERERLAALGFPDPYAAHD